MYIANVANYEAAWQAAEQLPHSHRLQVHEWLGRCMSKSEIRNPNEHSLLLLKNQGYGH
jgi:hypothetical protein